MFRAYIVEDEVNILNYIRRLLLNSKEFEIVGAFSIPEDAMTAFEQDAPQVVFLDIEMPRITGLELARQMRKKNQNINIIFLTAYSQYALEAFEVEALDYLLKPISEEDIQRVIGRLNKTVQNEKSAEPEAGNLDKINGGMSWPPIRCLGCFEVRDQSDELVKWPTKKAEEVFAYLLINQMTYLSKWCLLDLFWPELEEEKGLNNLYSTIYRIKQVLQKLPHQTTIRMLNAGYMLKAEGTLSDLDLLRNITKPQAEDNSISIREALFFRYKAPLFGDRGYLWSVSYQENVLDCYHKLYQKLLEHYQMVKNAAKTDKLVRHYITQHLEDEAMIRYGLSILQKWDGEEKRFQSVLAWVNTKLVESDLPHLEL